MTLTRKLLEDLEKKTNAILFFVVKGGTEKAISGVHRPKIACYPNVVQFFDHKYVSEGAINLTLTYSSSFEITIAFFSSKLKVNQNKSYIFIH